MTPQLTQAGPLPPTGTGGLADDPARAHKAAQAFEAAFLAEMLRAAGAGAPAGAMGGGIGEDQFASFLVTAQAEGFAARGGIGLAETVLRAMLRDSGATP